MSAASEKLSIHDDTSENDFESKPFVESDQDLDNDSVASNSELNKTGSPPKRGRGRPPKPTQTSKFAGSDSKLDKTLSSVKRGRGRPPKSTKTPEFAAKKSELNETASPVKKGRGRPPKSAKTINKPESESEETIDLSSDAQENEGGRDKKKKRQVSRSLTPDRKTIKRKVAGRKSLYESGQESDNDSVASNAKMNGTNSQKKKGRGRPPKSAKASGSKKRGRGRPPYSAKSVPKQRGRGRPRKLTETSSESDLEEVEGSSEDYEVEEIIGEKRVEGRRYFLVKWKNWKEDDSTWECADHVDCDELIKKFRDSCRSNDATKRLSTSMQTKSKKAKKAHNDDSDDDNDPLSLFVET